MIASAIGIATGRLPRPSGVLGRDAAAADCCRAGLGELALDLGVVELGERRNAEAVADSVVSAIKAAYGTTMMFSKVRRRSGVHFAPTMLQMS